MKTEEFDRRFDNEQDISAQLDFSRASRPNHQYKRVNVDFPEWMVNSLDKEAARLGVPRQSLIKVLIAQHLEKLHA